MSEFYTRNKKIIDFIATLIGWAIGWFIAYLIFKDAIELKQMVRRFQLKKIPKFYFREPLEITQKSTTEFEV